MQVRPQPGGFWLHMPKVRIDTRAPVKAVGDPPSPPERDYSNHGGARTSLAAGRAAAVC